MDTGIISGFRLSPQQKSVWTSIQDSSQCISRAALWIEGNVSPALIRETVHRVAERHDVFTATFHQVEGMAVPLQALTGEDRFTWEELDRSVIHQAAQESVVDRFFNNGDAHLRDLGRGPLLKVQLLQWRPRKFLLYMDAPSLCTDAHGLSILCQEIGTALNEGMDGLDSESIPYVRFSEWQNDLLSENGHQSSEEF